MLLIAVAAAGVLVYLFDPARYALFPKCPVYTLTGYYCPGCGSQRALHHLLHLDLQGTIAHNLLFIPAGLLISYHWIRKLIVAKTSLNLPDVLYYKATPWVILVVVLAYWVMRNVSAETFSAFVPG